MFKFKFKHKYEEYEKFSKYNVNIYRKKEEFLREGRKEFKFNISRLTWWTETGGLLRQVDLLHRGHCQVLNGGDCHLMV